MPINVMLGKSTTLIIVAALVFGGCPADPSGFLVDPPSAASELAGYWNGSVGCLHVDESGDLVSVTGNTAYYLSWLGIDVLYYDGLWRPSTIELIPVEYSGTAEVVYDGHTATFEGTVVVRAAGVTIGRYIITAEGTVSGDTFQGTMSESSTIPFLTTPREPASITLTRSGGCS